MRLRLILVGDARSTLWKTTVVLLAKAGIRLLGLWAVVIAGCATPKVQVGNPDLVSMPDGPMGGGDYCYFSTGGYVRIAIQNQGQGDAPPTSTRIVFSPGGTIDIPTPPVKAGKRTSLSPVEIPLACFDPDCDFKVTADSRSQAHEASGKENTFATGRCMRP